MAENPTSLEDLKTYHFLAKRVDYLTQRILLYPEDTVLWIGAGISVKYGSFPSWSQFLHNALDDYLCKDSRDYVVVKSLIESGRYSYAAEYLDEVSGMQLRSRIVSTFGAMPPHLPYELGNLCVREIITTNYDKLIEEAMPWYESATPAVGLERLMAAGFRLVKIHGSVDNPAECVLSLSSYVRAYNVNLRWYLLNVFQHNSVVFLGTSMSPSEPYFEVLRILRRSGKQMPKHVAVKAYTNGDEAKWEAKKLQELGIDLVPYIPDVTHSFVDALLNSVEMRRGDSETVHARVQIARSHLKAGRKTMAAVHAWHICNSDIRSTGDRRKVADLVSVVFSLLNDASTGGNFYVECRRCRIDLGHLWDRTAEFVDPTTKSVHGLEEALGHIERIERARSENRRRMLSTLKQQIGK